MYSSHLTSLARRFRSDRRGSVLILFAGAAAVGVILVGGIFDYWRHYRGLLALQKASDAAALVAKKTEANYVATYGILRQAEGRTLGETTATAYFQQNMAREANVLGRQSVSDPTYSWNDTTGEVTVRSSATVPTFFSSQVFPVNFYTVNALSRAEMDISMATEITMVLDNTTSMFSLDGRTKTRFTLLREATLGFVNNVFDAALASNNPEAVRVAVVPWATTVNVMGEKPAALDYSAFAMTTPGDKGSMQQVSSPIARTSNVAVNANDFLPVVWRGCITGSVESKTTYTDAAVNNWQASAMPNAPDLYNEVTYSYKIGTGTCSTSPTINTIACSNKQSSSFRGAWYIPTTMQCLSSQPNSCSTASQISSVSTTLQPCVADYNEPRIQNNTLAWCSWITKSQWETQGGGTPVVAGPNESCPSPMLGLSSNRRQVIETVNRMSPATGGTHQDVGLRWALRTLSPNNGWPSFFQLDAPPKAWKVAEKVAILITDGNNQQASTKAAYWGSSASDSNLDTMMLGWCDAMRNTYGVKVYTVAVNVTDTTAKNLLLQCVGGSAYADRAFTVDAANLQDALKSIGRSLKNLKLTM